MSFAKLANKIHISDDRRKRHTVPEQDRQIVKDVLSVLSDLIAVDPDATDTLFKNGLRRNRIKDKKQ